MKTKIIKEEDGWYIVSSIYEPPSAGRVGSGAIWLPKFKTRKEARKEKRINPKRYR